MNQYFYRSLVALFKIEVGHFFIESPLKKLFDSLDSLLIDFQYDEIPIKFFRQGQAFVSNFDSLILPIPLSEGKTR